MNLTGSPQELLWQYQIAIAKAGAGAVLAYIVVTTALYSAADILMVEDGVYFLISMAGWALGYLLLRYLMKASTAPGEAMLGGFGGYFALGLVSGVAIIAGLILLIIPGLYLFLRCCMCMAMELFRHCAGPGRRRERSKNHSPSH